jgi:hypothetical protein
VALWVRWFVNKIDRGFEGLSWYAVWIGPWLQLVPCELKNFDGLAVW